jgi:hypothetical protein
MSKVDFGERQRHWLRNVTEPVVTFSVRERPRAFETVRGALALVKPSRTCPVARLEPV